MLHKAHKYIKPKAHLFSLDLPIL